MTLETMYAPQKDSPSTFIMGDITSDDTHILVGSADILPSPPFPLTLAFDKSITETVIVTSLGSGGNNQLTVVRGSSPLAWPAGTRCARIFTASDLSAVQKNILAVASETDINATNIEKNTSDISTNKLAIAAETTRAKTAEEAIDSAKPNRTELTVLITDAAFTQDEAAVEVEFTTYDASAKSVNKIKRYLPIVNNVDMGIMTPEAYNEITRLRNDVLALQQQGGRFIGVSFETKAALNAFVVPSTVNSGDFTYVLKDETRSNATTRYIYNGTSFVFGFVVEYEPIGLATSTEPGLVLSDSGVTGGKIFVETDGSMSVVGWDSVLQAIVDNLTLINKHASRHAKGGADEITPANIGAEVSGTAGSAVTAHDGNTAAHSTLFGSKANLTAFNAHASRHATGGADAVTPANIGAEVSGTAGSAVTAHNGNTEAHSTLFGSKAPLASPAFTGIPTAETAAKGTNTKQLATTEFVLANASEISFVYNCTGTADDDAITFLVNNFFNSGTAMSMNLIISGVMGLSSIPNGVGQHIRITGTNTRGAWCRLDFSNCHIPTITTADRMFVVIASSTIKMHIVGLVVSCTSYAVYAATAGAVTILSDCEVTSTVSSTISAIAGIAIFNNCYIKNAGNSSCLFLGDGNYTFNNCTIVVTNTYIYTVAAQGSGTTTFNNCIITSAYSCVYCLSSFSGKLNFFNCNFSTSGDMYAIYIATANTSVVIRVINCTIYVAGTSYAINQTSAASTITTHIIGCIFSTSSIYVNGAAKSVSTATALAFCYMPAYANMFSRTIT